MHSDTLYQQEKVMPIPIQRNDLQRKDCNDINYEFTLQVYHCDLFNLTNWLIVPLWNALDEKLHDHINEEEYLES